jgi:hypothetical protein
MPSPDSDTAFIRVRRDVHARLGVAVAIAGGEQCDVTSELLSEAMDARKTPHPDPKSSPAPSPDVAVAAGQMVKKALRRKAPATA